MVRVEKFHLIRVYMTLREMCPNTEFLVVCIFLYLESDKNITLAKINNIKVLYFVPRKIRSCENQHSLLDEQGKGRKTV